MSTQRKPGPQATPAAVSGWRQYERTVKDLERVVERDPARFADRLVIYTAFLLRVQQDYRDYLRDRFGIEYRTLRTKDEAGCRFRMACTKPKRAPRTRQERAAHAFVHLEIVATEAFFRDLLVAIEEAKRNGADVDRAMCEACLRYFRLIPGFYGVVARAGSQPAAMREVALLRLSAWLETQVAVRVPGRPEQPTRTKRALDDEGLTLREALPPAALLSFADMEPGEPLRRTGRREKTLVNRVESHLAKQGREATEKELLTDEAPNESVAFEQSESVPRAVPRELELGQRGAKQVEGPRQRIRPKIRTRPPADVDLDDFELQEVMRQQRRQLDAFEQVARLSPQQKAVWERRFGRGMEIAEIATELDISENHVSVQLNIATKKLTEARKAAGF